MNQPVYGSTSPRAVISHTNEWPCSLAHLCSAGTRGNRCAASNLNSLTSSTIIAQRYLVDETMGKFDAIRLSVCQGQSDCPLGASHSFTVLSALPVARTCPSREKATALT